MRHGSLFSGIGGFDLAAEWMGWKNIFHCEWNPFGQKVLKHYWPDAISYNDITKTDFSIHRGSIDIITGGFPCQPYSQAGKRKGKEDERHLWPEMLRAIREIQPGWVVGENVSGLLNWNGGLVLDEIKADLEAEGFEVFPPCVLPACGVNAPHRRDRVWIVAYSASNRQQPRDGNSEGRNKGQSCSKGIRNGFRVEDIADGSRGVIAHPNGNVHTRGLGNRCAAETTKRSKAASEQQAKCEENGERVWVEPSTRCEDVADTSEQGLESRKQSERGSAQEEDRTRLEYRTANASINGNAANSNSRRQSGEEYRQEEPGQFTEKGSPTDWQNFPTVPALCDGDDGFRSVLDLNAISYPKWRNESIKAGGNAIVPQVAFEIFKAIEQTEIKLFA